MKSSAVIWDEYNATYSTSTFAPHLGPPLYGAISSAPDAAAKVTRLH